jgi:hypothetical protein
LGFLFPKTNIKLVGFLVCLAFGVSDGGCVDVNAGALFDVEVNDLNGDGKQDLLVVSNGNNGSVLAYEIPNDFR